jgi:DNA-binding transcriptional LysR family regulator
MQKLKKALPPLDPLVAFEAAARHLSFTRAAIELDLSQAAVSQQIRNLEQSLGTELFVRSHRAVRLSSAGRSYQHSVSSALRQLAAATTDLREPPRDMRLTVAADQSISSMWLLPRLPGFQQRYASVRLRLIASDDERDCLADDVQIAIIHGDGRWPGYNARQLFAEEVFPVCSPGYLESIPPVNSASDLLSGQLLELEDEHWDWTNWQTWLGRNDSHLPAGHAALQINNYPLLIEAARNGQGIALGWRYLVDADLQSGRLVKALDASVATRFGYYLLWQDAAEQSSAARQFTQWAMSQYPQRADSNYRQ